MSLLLLVSFFIQTHFLVHVHINDLPDRHTSNVAFRKCSYADFLRPARSSVGRSKSMPLHVVRFLKEIDHVFLLCLHRCRTTIPSEIVNRSTHVLGSHVDSCAPSGLTSGKYEHALKVTFTHAIILQRAIEMRYKHVAVIEDDVLFLQQSAGKEVMLKNILDSQHWSLLRFGYRPYFLQEHGVEPCPATCRCRMESKFSEHFCHLESAGCDLRSSDFYVISSRYYKVFQDMLLDTRIPDSKRIVDVHPMRSLSNQWLIIPQHSFQGKLDIPLDYQVGSAALFVRKCLHPRPLPYNLTAPLSRSHIWR